MQGFEGFLASKDTLKRRSRGFKVEDRAFSLSSKSSYAVSCKFLLILLCDNIANSDVDVTSYLHSSPGRDATILNINLSGISADY